MTRKEVFKKACDEGLYPALLLADPPTTIRIREGEGVRSDKRLMKFAQWANSNGCSCVLMPRGMETVPPYRLVVDVPEEVCHH